MKTSNKIYWFGSIFMAILGFASCSDEYELPEHNLDVEFKYELTCSEVFLKYSTPQVTITDGKGLQQTLTIEDNMWTGSGHKTWTQSVHYDSLNVSSTMAVTYLPKVGVTYQDELDFDNVHYLSCLISVKEDGDGRRNNYTIIPDFPAKSDVTASALKTYIEGLGSKTTTRGGSVDLKGEITKIEND